MPPAPTRFRQVTEARRGATISLALALLLAWVSPAGAAPPVTTIAPGVQVYDARLHDFIARQPELELLADGLQWAEGPVWVPTLDSLLFSDVAADRIYRWNERDGLAVYLEPSGHGDGQPATPWRGANGLALDSSNRLYLAQQGNRVLARLAVTLDRPEPRFDILADRLEGKKLNSPNDLVIHRSGSVFFTDPPYGLAGFENSPDIELGYFGVFRLDPDGRLEAVVTDLDKPNGIALSPDERLLYVGNSGEGFAGIIALELDQQGRVRSRQPFFEARDQHGDGPGAIDGMAMHRGGFLFTSMANGIGILAADGTLLGKLALGQVTNLAFDDRYEFLYVTTPARLLRMKLN